MGMITPFTYGDKPVRTQTDEAGDPWFVAMDVCDVLEIANVSQATESLDADEKDSISIIDTIGREKKVLAVSEPGLYHLILTSRKPEAKAFRRWVKHDVLPAIRKTGQYGRGASPLDVLASGAEKIRTKLAELDTVAGAFLDTYNEARRRGDEFKDSVKGCRNMLDGVPSGPPQAWFYVWLVAKSGNMLQVKTGISTNLAATEQEYRRQNPKGKWLLRKLIAADTIVESLESEIQDRILPQEMRIRGKRQNTESFDIFDYLLSPFIDHCEQLTELTIAGVQSYNRPQTLWG